MPRRRNLVPLAPPPLWEELQNAGTVQDQLKTLRKLKNEIVGSEQLKKLWINLGIVPAMRHILQTRRRDTGKGISKDLNGDTPEVEKRCFLSEEDMCCVLGTNILGSLAQSGTQFIFPLLVANVQAPLLTTLSSNDCPPQLALAVLRTLNTIADYLPPEGTFYWPRDQRLAQILYTKESAQAIARIIGSGSISNIAQQSSSLAACLMSKTLINEQHKDLVVEVGVLDSLATKLASFVVSQGCVLPTSEALSNGSGLQGRLPLPAPANARAYPFLQLTAVIVEGSKTRAEHLLCSPTLQTVFPRSQPEIPSSEIKRTPWGSSTYLSGYAIPRHQDQNPIDTLLPNIPGSQLPSSHNSNFPPLGSSGLQIASQPSLFQAGSTSTGDLGPSSEIDDTDENALIPWLILLVREETDLPRIMAAKLLVSLFRLGYAHRKRTSQFRMTIVPLLVCMLEKGFEPIGDGAIPGSDVLSSKLRIKEETPAILAALIMDKKELQRAAFDAHAIKRLSQLLKESYDPLPHHAVGMWTPERTMGSGAEHTNEPERMLGHAGPTPMARHLMKLREGLLQALAAIAPFEDEYRKAICDQGIVPYIIDSLKPYCAVASMSHVDSRIIPGNASGTLLAACGATRALTRSVSILRTSLIDAGVTEPLLQLIGDQNVDVQIAATAVVCNLALDFSPMKELIIKRGITKVLSQHAHGGNVGLRIESVWALKHLVYNASNEIKQQVFHELDPTWIKQVISSDPFNNPNRADLSGDPSRNNLFSVANARGDHVNLLNSEPIPIDMSPETKAHLDQFHRNVAARKAEYDAKSAVAYTNQHRQDDVLVQEQVIDLIRNMICDSTSGKATEVTKHILDTLGANDFLGIMADRLRPRASHNPHRKDNRPHPSKDEVLIAVLYVLIHLAAGEGRVRRLLAKHREILALIVPLMDHKNQLVRLNSCWIVINLTYPDNDADASDCRQRAKLLDELGFTRKLHALQDDPVLDVKERTKTALSLMHQSLPKGGGHE
ncbi:MAG: hypothetical protein Q9227_005792 [Pyrenula ochraceoflavens]